MRRIIELFIFVLVLWATPSLALSSDLSVQEIDEQVRKLEQLQKCYKASADHHRDEADRWQFQRNQLQEARRAWEEEDVARAKIKEIQGQIDVLETRKKELLKEEEKGQ